MNTVSDVMIVRLRVSLMALLMMVPLLAPTMDPVYSLIRSKTITVSFIEKPITVRIAAIKCWSISNGKGTTSFRNENTANVTNTSCSNATSVPTGGSSHGTNEK